MWCRGGHRTAVWRADSHWEQAAAAEPNNSAAANHACSCRHPRRLTMRSSVWCHLSFFSWCFFSQGCGQSEVGWKRGRGRGEPQRICSHRRAPARRAPPRCGGTSVASMEWHSSTSTELRSSISATQQQPTAPPGRNQQQQAALTSQTISSFSHLLRLSIQGFSCGQRRRVGWERSGGGGTECVRVAMTPHALLWSCNWPSLAWQLGQCTADCAWVMRHARGAPECYARVHAQLLHPAPTSRQTS